MQSIKNMLHHGHKDHDTSDKHHHATATLDGHTIAETQHFEFVEGNIYFPPSSLKDIDKLLTESDYEYSCPWKGKSQYYDVHVGGKTFKNAAWAYPHPLEKATNLKDYVAFDKGQVKTHKDN